MQAYTSNQKIINSQKIKKAAKEIGFDFCGIAPAEELENEKYFYKKWLSLGYHGKMSYLEKNFELRFNPSLFFENAKSVISLAVNYFPQEKQNPYSYYKISKYAYGRDYHLLLKKKISQLHEYLKEELGHINGRGFVDSAPVLEKTWAQKAGLGWTGKNGCFIIPKHGSYYFLGELIVDMELAYDEPFMKNHCGNCTKCLDNCPTGAIEENNCINAQKCISYLTIELKDDLAINTNSPKFKNWIFGCDICQDICPWNKFAKPAKKNFFKPNETILNYNDNQWENLSKEQYSSYIKKASSPIARIKYDKLKSNIKFVKQFKIKKD